MSLSEALLIAVGGGEQASKFYKIHINLIIDQCER